MFKYNKKAVRLKPERSTIELDLHYPTEQMIIECWQR